MNEVDLQSTFISITFYIHHHCPDSKVPSDQLESMELRYSSSA